jgi:hypothetical protein
VLKGKEVAKKLDEWFEKKDETKMQAYFCNKKMLAMTSAKKENLLMFKTKFGSTMNAQ